MYLKEVRMLIRERYGEDVIFLGVDEGPDCYDQSIVGISDDNRLVYDRDAIVMELMNDNEWTEEEAIEWLDYNIVRAIPYAGPEGPILIENFIDLYGDAIWIADKKDTKGERYKIIDEDDVDDE